MSRHITQICNFFYKLSQSIYPRLIQKEQSSHFTSNTPAWKPGDRKESSKLPIHIQNSDLGCLSSNAMFKNPALYLRKTYTRDRGCARGKHTLFEVFSSHPSLSTISDIQIREY
ncbi:MAG: hypothetical protein QM654_00895 [Dysgonamonadaceae bacterium]